MTHLPITDDDHFPQGTIYFSVADRQVEALQGDAARSSFEQSLYHHALFDPAIALSDIFFFISQSVGDHVLAKPGFEQSFLEACIVEGVLVPVFRNRANATFRKGLDIVCGGRDPKDAIQGIRGEAVALANRLDQLTQVPAFRPGFWPSQDVGVHFGDMVDRALGASSPGALPVGEERLAESIWTDTARWRTECIAHAREKSPTTPEGVSLRRGEIMNAVGVALGYPSPVHDIGDLLRLPDLDDSSRFRLAVYFRWINALYQLNQAQQFGLKPNLPDYDPLVHMVLAPLLTSATDNPPAEETGAPVVVTVPFPTLESLQRTPPGQLLAVRKSMCPAYFGALATYGERKDEESGKYLKTVFCEYAKQIVKAASPVRGFSETLMDLVARDRMPTTRAVLSGGANAAAVFASVAIGHFVSPILGVGAALGVGVNAVWQWRASWPVAKTFRLGAFGSNARPTELTAT